MTMIYIKPNTTPDGKPLKVRLPNKPHEFMPAAGMSVKRSQYWVRRLIDGSVIGAVKLKKGRDKTVNQEIK